MRIRLACALLGALVSALVPRAAVATPPSAPRIAFELRDAESPHSAGQRATFPLTLRALRSVPAGELRLLLPPGDLVSTTYSYPDLDAGDVRTLSVSLPVSRIGTYTVIAVAPLSQLDFTVLIRPDRVQAVTSEEYEAVRRSTLRGSLNDPRRTRRDAPLDGIQIAIVPEKTHYRHGEPISFDVTIANSGNAPRTLVDGNLGFRELAVLIDGATVGNQGFGKRVGLTDPFPDGILRLAPGASWKKRVTFDNAKDLDDLAGWPVHTFTYRFMFQSFAVPFFTSGPGLANLWQGSLTAGDNPGQTIVIEPGSAVIIPWVPRSMRMDGGAGSTNADASDDASRRDAGSVAEDAGSDAGVSAPPASSHKGFGCAMAARRSEDSSAAPVLALLGLLLVRRRARSEDRGTPSIGWGCAARDAPPRCGSDVPACGRGGG